MPRLDMTGGAAWEESLLVDAIFGFYLRVRHSAHMGPCPVRQNRNVKEQ